MKTVCLLKTCFTSSPIGGTLMSSNGKDRQLKFSRLFVHILSQYELCNVFK